MPRISAFYGIVISMNWQEHLPPHFHAIYAEFEASVLIASGELLNGTLPPRALRLVRHWAGLHREALGDNWERARSTLPLVPIEPLP